MFESAAVIGRKSKVLLWHVPAHSSGYIPDSRELWDFLWRHRRELVGIAHTHPGGGTPGPSMEDVTTFCAIEAALGRRLNWWISNSDMTVVCRWRGPDRHDYGVEVTIEPSWVTQLRRNSEIPVAEPSATPMYGMEDMVVEEPTTACKHGRHDCERCGTTSRRDQIHRTVNGKGEVSRIR